MNVALQLFLAWLGFAIVIGLPTWISLRVRERREQRSAKAYRGCAAEEKATTRDWPLHPHRVSDGIC